MTRGLAGHGAAIACVDIDAERARSVTNALIASGARAAAIVADLTQEVAVDAAVRTALDAFGTIDVAINNAGITTVPKRTHELAVADWDRLLAINLRGTFLVTRAVLPAMLAAQRGSIVNLSSIYGLGGFYPGFPAGVASYAATNLGHEGRSNATPEEIARLEGAIHAAIPMGRRGTVDELEGLAVYLASDASSYVTGQVFAHDGGWSAT